MKDLYRPHPTKPDLWSYVGRTDDMVVLSNGEKIAPHEAESMVASDPDVRAVLMIGDGRFQPNAACRFGAVRDRRWPVAGLGGVPGLLRARWVHERSTRHSRPVPDGTAEGGGDVPQPRHDDAARGTVAR